MPTPGGGVADLIIQLMKRGQSGGMPMQASPELTQYLAHAQGGTTTPQLAGAPSADVLQGPGSAMADIRNPNFLANEPAAGLRLDDPDFNPQDAAYDEMMARRQGNDDPLVRLEDLLSDRPRPDQFRQESYGDFAGTPLFIWVTNPKTGKRIKLDGPFTDDIQAARELRELRKFGFENEVEIAPDYDGPNNPLPPLNS